MTRPRPDLFHQLRNCECPQKREKKLSQRPKARNPPLIYCLSKAIRPDTSLRLAATESQKNLERLHGVDQFRMAPREQRPTKSNSVSRFAKLGLLNGFLLDGATSPTRGHSFGVQSGARLHSTIGVLDHCSSRAAVDRDKACGIEFDRGLDLRPDTAKYTGNRYRNHVLPVHKISVYQNGIRNKLRLVPTFSLLMLSMRNVRCGVSGVHTMQLAETPR